MSRLVCKNCKSIAVEYEDYVGGTSYYRCKTCGAIKAKDKFTQMTIFDQITESPETLTETLVYCEQPEYQYSCASWRSVVLGNVSYARKSEAIAATIAKLKKVAE